MWLSVDEYANQKRITKQAVYKRIKLNKVSTKKDDTGKILIEVNSESVDQHPNTFESTSDNKPSLNTELDTIKDFIGGFLTKFENHTTELKTTHNRELANLKEHQKEITKIKDDQISELKTENEKLKADNDRLKKKKRPFIQF